MSDNATKPREFWVDLRSHSGHYGRKTNRHTAWSTLPLHQRNQHTIKFIEIEAYDALQKQLDEAKGIIGAKNIQIQMLKENDLELEAENTRLREALKKAEKRFSHIEDWHRDNVTPDNFEDCQEVGQTPEAYLRDGKNECREALKKGTES